MELSSAYLDQYLSEEATEATGEDTRHTILVPLANPNTAPVLLELATVIAGKEQGRVIGLVVTANFEQANPQLIERFERTIRAINRWDDACEITLLTRRTASVSVGIMEVAHEYEVDQILLGLTDPVRGQVELGDVVETLVENAPCDVLVYRDSESPGFTRVVVPVGGSVASRVTVAMGVRLAKGVDRACEVLHVYASHRPEWESRMRVEKMLSSVRGHNLVQTKIVPGLNETESILSNTTENDMLVVGKSERSELEKWLYGNTAQRLLDRAPGPVLLVARSQQHTEDQTQTRRRLSWLRPILGEAEQEQILWNAQDTAAPSLDYFVLIIVASLLASLGLLLNSGAVIIGAMLVAPLMGPIVSFGVGLCTARFRLLRQASVTVLLGTFAAMLVGYLLGLLAPPNAPTAELLGRGFPSFLDAGVATGAGFIAAYATARKRIPAALTGVAIAAALVPPVNAFGINLATGELRLAFGAGLLFVTNIMCIAMVGAGVFFWLGMRPQKLEDQQKRWRYVTILATFVIVIPVLLVLLNFGRRVSSELISPNDVIAAFAPARVVDIEVVDHEPVIVKATLLVTDEEQSLEAVDIAQEILSNDLGEPVQLQVVVQRLVEGTTGGR